MHSLLHYIVHTKFVVQNFSCRDSFSAVHATPATSTQEIMEVFVYPRVFMTSSMAQFVLENRNFVPFHRVAWISRLRPRSPIMAYDETCGSWRPTLEWQTLSGLCRCQLMSLMLLFNLPLNLFSFPTFIHYPVILLLVCCSTALAITSKVLQFSNSG